MTKLIDVVREHLPRCCAFSVNDVLEQPNVAQAIANHQDPEVARKTIISEISRNLTRDGAIRRLAQKMRDNSGAHRLVYHYIACPPPEQKFEILRAKLTRNLKVGQFLRAFNDAIHG